MRSGWTTPRDIAARVRGRWDDGSLLRGHAQGAAFEAKVAGSPGPFQPGGITPDQLVWGREMAEEIRTYFPQIGDGPKVIAAKAQARKEAERQMEIMAGNAVNLAGGGATGSWETKTVRGKTYVLRDGEWYEQ